MEKGYKRKPMNRNHSKKKANERGSSNKKQKLDGQRIGTRRSKRLDSGHPRERQKSGTILSWLIDSQIIPECATIYYIGATNLAGFKKGTLERNGILCTCCQCIFTIRGFQVHTGGKVCDDPYDVIGVDGIRCDGSITPISQCMQLALQNKDEPEHYMITHITAKGYDEDVYDDACILCADGGNLICCEQCTSTFHAKCLGLKVKKKMNLFCS